MSGLDDIVDELIARQPPVDLLAYAHTLASQRRVIRRLELDHPERDHDEYPALHLIDDVDMRAACERLRRVAAERREAAPDKCYHP